MIRKNNYFKFNDISQNIKYYKPIFSSEEDDEENELFIQINNTIFYLKRIDDVEYFFDNIPMDEVMQFMESNGIKTFEKIELSRHEAKEIKKLIKEYIYLNDTEITLKRTIDK